jgi:protein-S-isoprenylcysteine O-methyltransferase Ste14
MTEKRIIEDEHSPVRGHVPKGDCLPKPPVLFAWLASVTTISTIVVSQFLPQGDNPYLRGAGVCMLLLAGVFIFWPFALLARYGGARDGQAYMQASVVVDRGLYAIVRHPQYLGYIFLACGFALLSQHGDAVLLAAASATFFYLQAVREEGYCRARFGEPYERYRRRVPRFNVVLGVIRRLREGRSD